MTNYGESDVKTIWDIPINSLFPLVLEFYRKEKDHLVLDYGQRIKLLAFYKQEKLGPYTPEKDVDTGYFDVMGSDRRKAWMSLGNMNQEESRQGLINLLDAATPKLRQYVFEQWKAQGTAEEEEKKRVFEDEEQDVGELMKKEDPITVNGHSAPSATPIPDKPETKSVLAPAALWCSPKAAKHFLNQAQRTPESQLLVSGGESVSIQVPTSEEGSAIFWEFVTESGDIGFGLSFQKRSEGARHECPMEELLPIVRRDCSEDLVLGSHQYQSQGTYFLQFDNSYSPNVTKVVYYKVFYQKTT